VSLVGSGVELTSVPRFRATLERRGERLLERLFSAEEIAYAAERPGRAEHLAARFAAKMAARRALRGLCERPVPFADLEVVRAESGAPALALRGATERRLAGLQLQIALSLTHDAGFGLASVWVEREPGVAVR
jgi:holo-[acyl-carrier protein] synthase